jgi:transcriptional regulator GlxA family with amidase domain
MPDQEGRVRVAILAYPEVTASVVYAMHDLLSAAGRDWTFITTGVPGQQRMSPFIVSAGRAEILTANGASIRTDYGFEDCPPPDIVCVPDFTLAPDDPCTGRFDAEVAWLRDCYRSGAALACTCTGAIMLAQTGLLDGMEATIHWNYAPSLTKYYPRLKVDPDKALVVTGADHRIVMAGGGTSHLDLILYLIARFVGLTQALEVAKAYLIIWHDAGQRPFTSLITGKQTSDALIARCQEWAADHYAEAAPVGAMVRLSKLSERTFVRRFTRATGMSPLDYIHALRLEEAKQILETQDLPVEAVALEIGYQDNGFFGRMFRRRVGMTPGQYRRRFGYLRSLLEECRDHSGKSTSDRTHKGQKPAILLAGRKHL